MTAAKRAAKTKPGILWICLGFVLLAGLTAAAVLLLRPGTQPDALLTYETVHGAKISGFRDADFAETALDDSLTVCRAGIYRGVFVEQATDKTQKTLAVIVCNRGKDLLRKAEFTACGGDFIVTWLPAGACCLVQAQSGTAEITADPPVLLSAVYASDRPDLHPEAVALRGAKGELVMENVSGRDLPGSVTVWYKTVRDGLFFGGLTYRAAVDDGILYKDAVATVRTGHYDPETSVLIAVELSAE